MDHLPTVLSNTWRVTIVASRGVLDFFAVMQREPWAALVLVDLVLALFIATGWVLRDARRKGLPGWPYVLGALPLGSTSVLAYLVHRELAGRKRIAG